MPYSYLGSQEVDDCVHRLGIIILFSTLFTKILATPLCTIEKEYSARSGPFSFPRACHI